MKKMREAKALTTEDIQKIEGCEDEIVRDNEVIFWCPDDNCHTFHAIFKVGDEIAPEKLNKDGYLIKKCECGINIRIIK
jgi:hypothetical protein